MIKNTPAESSVYFQEIFNKNDFSQKSRQRKMRLGFNGREFLLHSACDEGTTENTGRGK